MVTKAQVPNYLVVAIDTQLRDDLVAKGYNVYYRDITVSCSIERQPMPLSYHTMLWATAKAMSLCGTAAGQWHHHPC